MTSHAADPAGPLDRLAAMFDASPRLPREGRIRIYQEALEYALEIGRPALRASLQIHVAKDLLDDRSTHRAESIEQAIAGLEEAARTFADPNLPIPRAEAWTLLASAYLERIRGLRQANVETAIGFCRRALQIQNRRTRPASWAEVADHLASALSARARRPRAIDQEKGLDLYRRALPLREINPTGWVSTAVNFANALNQRISGDRAENLEEAILLLERAERTLAPEGDSSSKSATVRINLAVMYRERLRGDATAHREQAIKILEALLAPGRELPPVDRGRALHLLAALQVERSRGRRAQNLERAIENYRQALEIHTFEALPTKWMETTQNLATAYAERLEGDPAENVERAIDLYRQVLERVDRRETAEDWAIAATNLATALSDRREGERRKDLEDAVALYRQVLEIRREVDPRGWALTQMNMGNAFAGLDLGGALGAFESSVEAYRRALEVHRIEALPGEHRRTQGNLADLYFARGRWSEALELTEVVERVRQFDPGLQADGMSLEAILSLAERLGFPLVFLLTTTLGSVGLLTFPGGEIETVFLDPFTAPAGETADLRLLARGDAPTMKAALSRLVPALEERIVAPLAASFKRRGVSRACLIPCGSLAHLPLAALAPEGLVLQVCPSIRAMELAEARRRRASEVAPRILAVGDPSPQRPLAFAALETREIAALFPAGRRKVLLGSEATFASVRHELSGATHLHLSCHGEFQIDEPLGSHLDLAGGEPLRLRDLFDPHRLDLTAARLVVLSACRSGATDQELPDEALGFPAAFLQAGVPAILSALWPVDDTATALLLIRFYSYHLTDRMDPAQALCASQRWLRTATARDLRLAEHCEDLLRGSKRRAGATVYLWLRRSRRQPNEIPFAHPYFWAGLVLNGL